MLRVNLQRFEDKIREYESYPIETGKILLYGSSFFTNWGYARAKDQLAPLDIVNHGFGGATVDELLYYYRRMVTPYAPSAMVVRGGANDLANGYSPEETMDMTERLCAWFRADYPGAKMLLMPVFDFKSLPERGWKGVAAYNAMLRVYCDRHEDCEYLDISPALYENPANVGTFRDFRDIFQPDGLHLTDAGYEGFAPWFRQQLQEMLGR